MSNLSLPVRRERGCSLLTRARREPAPGKIEYCPYDFKICKDLLSAQQAQTEQTVTTVRARRARAQVRSRSAPEGEAVADHISGDPARVASPSFGKRVVSLAQAECATPRHQGGFAGSRRDVSASA